MKRTIPFIFALAAAALAACATQHGDHAARADASAIASARSAAALARLASEYPGVGGAVYRDDELVWSFSTGTADRANAVAVTEATRFNIYSTSKALTGFAFARLIERDVVTLDTTVGEIAPDLPAGLHPIRIRHLLSHTSGVRHYASQQDWLMFAQRRCATPREAIAYFEDDPLVAPPGSARGYSTFAFVLASELLVRITEATDFAEALNGTLGPWADFAIDDPGADKAQAYIRAGQLPALPDGAAPDDIVPLPAEISAECKFGGGGLIASARQLARAGAALHQGRIIPSERLASALQPWSSISDTVYGGAVTRRDQGDPPFSSYSLSGGAPGGRSYLLVFVEPHIAVAIAGNIDGPDMAQTAWTIAEAWLAREYE